MAGITPLVSIITVNYNQKEVSCELLQSVKNNSYKNTEVILVDNASKENPLSYIKQRFPEVKVIVSEQNLGFAGGNNLAIPFCNGDYIFYVNNDAELTDGCIEKLIAAFEADPNLGIISPLICYFPKNKEEEIVQFAGATPISTLTARNKTIGYKEKNTGKFTLKRSTSYIHGAAMMTTKKVIERAGLMDDTFFLYYEELDWSESIKKAGFDVQIEPNAKVYHKESLTVGEDSPIKTYYINRNRILFMRRHKKGWQILLFSIFLLFAIIPKNTLGFIIRRKWANLKAFYRAIFWNLNNPARETDVKKINKLSSVLH